MRMKLVALGVSVFFAIALLYAVNFGLSFQDAVTSNVIRTMLVPSASETNFFVAFPGAFNYRGLSNSLDIRMNDAAEDDVSVYQVATVATGVEYSANASFLAVGWSGMGYAGVLLASVVVVGLLHVIDRMYASGLPPMDHETFIMLVGLCLVPAALGLTSGGVAAFLTDGGFINPIIAYWLLRRDSVLVPEPFQYAMGRGALAAPSVQR